MLTRRTFIELSALTASGIVLGCRRSDGRSLRSMSTFRMPDESAAHKRTWMAFGAQTDIWGANLLPEVRRNLALIANTIVQFEPVSMLVNPADERIAKKLLSSSVELLPFPLDDLWMRDTGPTFVFREDTYKTAIDFNFNGWGKKQQYKRDARVATFVAEQAGVPVSSTSLVLEGGCIEVDGEGTAIITESCVLNNNRNPEVSKTEFENLISSLLGLEKIIWLPGIRSRDITDGHTDFYARFVRPGVVFAGFDPDPKSYDHEITKQHIRILREAVDGKNRPIEVKVLDGPLDLRPEYETKDFAAGYIGYYLCNGAAIIQEFGDAPADAFARESLLEAFPEREIIQLNIDGIAAGGGSIHCATQQEPLG